MTNPALAAVVKSCALLGTEAEVVEVRCALDPVRSGWDLDGLSAAAARESSIRARSALATIGQAAPGAKVTIRVTGPAPVGGVIDLAIALAVLVAKGSIAQAALDGWIVLGELGLDGSVRGVRGVLAATRRARIAGARGVIVPQTCAWEAELVDDVDVCPVDSLADVVAMLRGPRARPSRRASTGVAHPGVPELDMAEVRGQTEAIDATVIAIAAGAGILFVGPPGTGKSMLARRVPFLLPALTRADAIEVTQVYSALGVAQSLIGHRPFRAPHHTISATALVGDVGPARRPGELQLAGRGVLYLDDLIEFSSAAITALASAIEKMAPDARPMIVASASACPCGWSGWASADGQVARACSCSDEATERYRMRLGKLTEALGLAIQAEVSTFSMAELRALPPGESSDSIRARIAAFASSPPTSTPTSTISPTSAIGPDAAPDAAP